MDSILDNDLNMTTFYTNIDRKGEILQNDLEYNYMTSIKIDDNKSEFSNDKHVIRIAN